MRVCANVASFFSLLFLPLTFNVRKKPLTCFGKGLEWNYCNCGGRTATPVGVAMSEKRLFWLGAIRSLVLAAQTSLWAPYGCQRQQVWVCMASLAELAAGTFNCSRDLNLLEQSECGLQTPITGYEDILCFLIYFSLIHISCHEIQINSYHLGVSKLPVYCLWDWSE